MARANKSKVSIFTARNIADLENTVNAYLSKLPDSFEVGSIWYNQPLHGDSVAILVVSDTSNYVLTSADAPTVVKGDV